MISSKPEISREGVIAHLASRRSGFMPQDTRASQRKERRGCPFHRLAYVMVRERGRGRSSTPERLCLPLKPAAYRIPVFAGMTVLCRSKILRLQFDRRAVRRAVGGVIPGIAIAIECFVCYDALGRDQLLQRRQPMPVIGLPGVGIALGLRALDLAGKRVGPFSPGEQSTTMQRERHRKGLRLPRFAKHRPVVVTRNAGHGTGCFERGGCIHHAASRYGSNASMDIFTVGSASGPHNSAPSNTTV